MANIEHNLEFQPAARAGWDRSSNSSVGFGDLLSHLNFATMVAADAEYGRFSLLTDFIYMNLGGTSSQFRSINFPNHPMIPISSSVQETSEG